MLPTLLLALLASVNTLTEPTTRTDFQTTLSISDQTLLLTGVGVRRALGQNAYAVAHYIAPSVGDVTAAPATTERNELFCDATTFKAIVFHGVYKSVPAQGIRHSWRKHFKALGEAPREDFIDAFKFPFVQGDRLLFLATPEGLLEVRHNDNIVGHWSDLKLVRSVWRMCLGPTSELQDRMALTARELDQPDSPEPTGRKESAKP